MNNVLENKIKFEELEEDLGKIPNSSEENALRNHKFPWKRLFLTITICLIVIGAGGFGVIKPILQLKSQAVILGNRAKEISSSLQAQNINQTIEVLSATKKDLTDFSNSYHQLKWVKFIPLVKNFYKDGEKIIKSSNYLLEAGEISIDALKPYGDLLGFKEESSHQENLTTEERLMLALDTLDKIQPHLNQIGEKLELAQKEIEEINPNRYPEQLFGKKIREKAVLLIKSIQNFTKMVEEIKPIVSYLKPLLGFPEEKKYLLLFQNDAELRPTGGFLTAYAILSVNKGNFKPLGSYDIYSLDARFGNRLKPPQPILDYHKNVYYWHLRDMNLSPDFKISMETFWENYKKVGNSDIKGIVAVDTKVLVDLLKVIGPIGVAEWGSFSAENDPRCNCPQVFYELEKLADKPVGTLKTERKAMIGPLMHSILLHVMQSPRKKWPEFFNLFFTNIQEKHILFYFFDEEIQKAIEALNAGGRIKDYEGDYLHINDCNFAGAKSNMFIKVNVNQEITVNPDREVIKTLTIDYRNPEPPSNCNLEAGQLCLNGLYRNWIRIYVPKGSSLIESSGSEITPRIYEELGKTVFEAFYGDKNPLRPLGKTQVIFKYRLPFKIKEGEKYRLLIQKQPGTYGYEYEIKMNDKIEKFELKTDREVKL